MRQQQLVAHKKRAFRPKTTVVVDRAEANGIANLVSERPDQIWVSYITYVARAEGWLYLAVILDLSVAEWSAGSWAIGSKPVWCTRRCKMPWCCVSPELVYTFILTEVASTPVSWCANRLR
jgi:hypothetical protein